MVAPLVAMLAPTVAQALMPTVTENLSKYMNFCFKGGLAGAFLRNRKHKKEAARFEKDYNKMLNDPSLSPQQKLAMQAQGYALQEGVSKGKISANQAMAMMAQMGAQYSMTNQNNSYFKGEFMSNPDWNLLNSFISDPALHFRPTNFEAMYSMNW